MPLKNILLTGYEPFDRFDYNPSGVIAERLNGQEIADQYVIRSAILPVDCLKMPPLLEQLWKEYQPVLVIGLGLAFGEAGIRLERTGHNLFNIAAPDNGGNVRVDVPIIDGAPVAYQTSLPLREISTALLEKGIPAYISDHAGGHLCNQFLYTVLHYTEAQKLTTPAGFIHLSGTPEQMAKMMLTDKAYRVPSPSMPLEQMQEAVLTVLNSSVKLLNL